jgi:hypothetical protein
MGKDNSGQDYFKDDITGYLFIKVMLLKIIHQKAESV